MTRYKITVEYNTNPAYHQVTVIVSRGKESIWEMSGRSVPALLHHAAIFIDREEKEKTNAAHNGE